MNDVTALSPSLISLKFIHIKNKSIVNVQEKPGFPGEAQDSRNPAETPLQQKSSMEKVNLPGQTI
ncbi:hypothetical protein [Rothia nasimurium]|uniref:hypothetical protein n=1 Tax=Rothia nasimurium TaxID=85336 RepID=UPI001F18D3E8|nr:hypothetical protein [Rothia nasimurium]